MKRTILAVTLALAFGTAFATGNNNGPTNNCNGNGSCSQDTTNIITSQGGAGGQGGQGGSVTIQKGAISNENTNVNINTLRSESKANAAAFQAQGQQQKATADNKGVTTTITTTVPRQAASASVGLAGITSAVTCDRGFSAGVGVGGAGTPISVGFASYYEVKKCNKREEARMKFVASERAFAMNLNDNALILFAQGVALLDEAEAMTRDEEGKPAKTAEVGTVRPTESAATMSVAPSTLN